jgi:hypothetical protein
VASEPCGWARVEGPVRDERWWPAACWVCGTSEGRLVLARYAQMTPAGPPAPTWTVCDDRRACLERVVRTQRIAERMVDL